MRHGMANKKLNRTSEHRKALLMNMLNSLIKYEQIKTTLPKAKFLKPQADKIITLGKKDSLHTTRLLVSKLQNSQSANKVKKHYPKDMKKEMADTLESLKLVSDMVIMHRWQLLNLLIEMLKQKKLIKRKNLLQKSLKKKKIKNQLLHQNNIFLC